MVTRKALLWLGLGAALCGSLPQGISTPSEISARAAAVTAGKAAPNGKAASAPQIKGILRGGDQRRYRKRRLGTGVPSCAAWDKRAARKRRNRARHKAHCRGSRR